MVKIFKMSEIKDRFKKIKADFMEDVRIDESRRSEGMGFFDMIRLDIKLDKEKRLREKGEI